MKHLLDLTELSKKELLGLIELAEKIKKSPEEYKDKLRQKSLLMIFEKPSLRTRISFEVGIAQLGGNGIFYDLKNSPMGEKESIADTAKTASRYVDVIMARLYSHSQLKELAENSSVPVINGLTDYCHPCQILSDLLTIKEKKGKLKGLKLAYLGDGNNNVAHSLLFGCSIMEIDISIGCPNKKEYLPQKNVIKKAKNLAKDNKVIITYDAKEAVKNSDIVYTDSWMSYHIPKEKENDRVKVLMPFQVNKNIMKHAKKDAIFMNCLPAKRGMEQTKEVIDGPQSIVFDQAENRLHMQKALLIKLLRVE